MILRTEMTSTGLQFVIGCACGWESSLNYTAEGAGREFDLHMAKVYPLPTSRRPCPAPPRSSLSPEDVKAGQIWEGADKSQILIDYVQDGCVSYWREDRHYLGMKISTLLRTRRLVVRALSGPAEAEAKTI